MKSQEFESTLLAVLHEAKFGLSIAKIAERMACSRTTASKYLKALEERQLVKQQDVGQYKLWIHMDQFISIQSRKDALSSFYEPFYDSIMHHLPLVVDDSDTIKRLGRAIAGDLAFSDMAHEMVEARKAALASSVPVKLAEVARTTMEIIDSIFRTFDSYEWAAPIVMNDQMLFILRMEGSGYSHLLGHFQLVAGILEAEIGAYCPVEVKVAQLLPEKKIVDLSFQLGSPSSPSDPLGG